MQLDKGKVAGSTRPRGTSLEGHPASVRFGRAIVGDLSVAESREFLVTNGIGGYGSGTIAGSISRGYHGLLVASAKPPIDRRIVLVKLDETLACEGGSFELGCNRWVGGSIGPAGHHLLEAFELQGSVPTWRYACGDVLLDKRIWMEDGQNTTYVSYTLVAASSPISLSAKAIVDNRVFHNTGQMNSPTSVEADGLRAEIKWQGELSLFLGFSAGRIEPAQEVYNSFQLPREAARGLNDADSHTHAATLTASLAVGETVVLVASTESDASPDLGALQRRWDRDSSLLRRGAGATQRAKVEPWVEQLTLAADQFVVSRPSPEQPDGKSVIAGYHWFEDWGRDTMISLPGLTIAVGRPEIVAPILRTFARFVDQGMLPNRFPDGSDVPQYNTIDATLWYFQAVASYFRATGDKGLLNELFPVLSKIIDAHVEGTRYDIKVDETDGLLRGGVPGVQLTWMDAKVGDWVVTPRIGKPIEVNALWYNALRTMERFATALNEPGEKFATLADRTAAGFARFWNEKKGYCFDVLDGPDGDEDSLRPNQLFAVSLPESPLTEKQRKAVVDICASKLWTSHGLRSLTPDSANYRSSYGGDQYSRDSAYHQGTTWGWLAGPFISAHLRVYQDTSAARRFLEPFADSLNEDGVGTLSEIFDGDPPFGGRGCIAQAWSVAEILRVVREIEKVENQNP